MYRNLCSNAFCHTRIVCAFIRPCHSGLISNTFSSDSWVDWEKSTLEDLEPRRPSGRGSGPRRCRVGRYPRPLQKNTHLLSLDRLDTFNKTDGKMCFNF